MPIQHVGRPLKRLEDPKLIQGRDAYVNDVRLIGALSLAFTRSPQPSTLAAPKKLMRAKPIPCLLRYPAKIGTLDIQRVPPKTGRGPQLVLVWGWPTPIRMNARTELPPERGKPVYGPAAREEVRRLMREAKREKINFGRPTKTSLCKVAKGERPLSYSVWEGAQAYVRRVRRERKHEQDVRERPLQFRVVPGQGPVVDWRWGSPS